jgi:Lar family restriction alleviation protein
MVEELKPCPFCGGYAEETIKEDDAGHQINVIECSECKVYSTFGESGSCLIREAWNKRA